MSAAPQALPLGEYVSTADQRIVMHGVPWSHYEAQLALRGDASTPRISYLNGLMELMSPSKHHERVKSYDPVLLCSFLYLPTVMQAVKAFRAALASASASAT